MAGKSWSGLGLCSLKLDLCVGIKSLFSSMEVSYGPFRTPETVAAAGQPHTISPSNHRSGSGIIQMRLRCSLGRYHQCCGYSVISRRIMGTDTTPHYICPTVRLSVLSQSR
ncbi:hypothetical protein J6590_020972 [Homalodisca vitripennis]|nr:hypothetical protein J6590_020972 [Homalodisca vitripennis]